MDLGILDELDLLDATATLAPWHVRFLDDVHFMSAVVLSTQPDNCKRNWPDGEIVAATLIQAPRYVDPPDAKWDENARLISAMRNCLPKLIRLARIGLALESNA